MTTNSVDEIANEFPSRLEMWIPILRALQHMNGVGSNQEIDLEVLRIMELPPEVTELPSPRGRMISGNLETNVQYDLYWARTDLECGGYISNVARARWGLTELGSATDIESIDIEEMRVRVRDNAGLTRDESSEVESLVDELARGNRAKGQSFSSCAKCRREVEMRAMNIASEFYANSGYEVEDVSGFRSYDLLCKNEDIELHVEVKGSKGDCSRILLTKNEVEHARDYENVALFIVSDIEGAHSASQKVKCTAESGTPIEIYPWDIDKGSLQSIAYSLSDYLNTA